MNSIYIPGKMKVSTATIVLMVLVIYGVDGRPSLRQKRVGNISEFNHFKARIAILKVPEYIGKGTQKISLTHHVLSL